MYAYRKKTLVLKGNFKNGINASKITKCKIVGQLYKFVSETTHPQYLYQVFEFKDMEQFRKFCQCEAGNHEIFRQVGARMIALRMLSCLQKIDLRQDKVKELTQQLYDIINVNYCMTQFILQTHIRCAKEF